MIFCLEDDSSIRDLMIYTLQAAGFDARGFAESTAFWAALEETVPQLVILDIMLPGEDGISVLKKMRQSPATEMTPVIMATARGNEYDRVIGLDLGADDYLCKPFGMMEMISRIKAVLRRTSYHEPKTVIEYEGLRMDTTRHSVTAAGKEVILTLKEYEVLKLFMENPGVVFSRDHLLASVWDMDYAGETRTVDVHIGTLRSKLGEQGALIRTVRGVGYRMG